MSDLSEDDSSDSSNEFLVEADKINVSCNFFTNKKQKVNKPQVKSETEDEGTDDDELQDVSQVNNIELFTQVLKNLENSQKLQIADENDKEQSSDQLTPRKEKGKVREAKGETEDFAISNEINELLLQGESSSGSRSKRNVDTPVKNEEDTEASSEYTIPKDGVKIVLPGTDFVLNRKKKKGSTDLKAILRRRLRASQILIEKVGLLCWLAYGFHLNQQVNQPEVLSTALSLIPSSNYPKNRIDLTYLEKFTKWFKNVFTFEAVENNDSKHLHKESLLKVLDKKKVLDYRELVLLYIAALRALGLNCRLVISLYPPHRIYNDDPLFKLDAKGQQAKSKSKTSKGGSTSKTSKQEASDKTDVLKNSPEAKKNANIEAKRRAAEVLRSKSQSESKSGTKKESKVKSNAKGNKNNEPEAVKEEKNVSNLRQLRSRKVNANSEDNKSKSPTDATSKTDGTKSKYYIEEDTDSEAEFEPKPKRLMKNKLNNTDEEVALSSKSKKIRKKVMSSDSENEGTKNRTRRTQDIWAEVYLESEESWICVSVMDEKIHCVTEVYKKAKKPVLYVIAWNSDGLIKDVTRRYCPHWLTVTRKQRIDEKWWLETLSYWKEKQTAISRAEDQMLLDKELEQPLPKTIGECKGHPLYVIVRHLLKFEGLYPPDCVPLGHTSTGEAIYSRHCVHTLCSRETWLKKARVVKPKQEAYKIVKARPKYDKLSGMKIKDSALELFGEWQTTEYEPPVAKDGIVPRNDYGNVDLFKQCMLPKGTVHIDLPGLNRVARKLNIDCAPAVVGFNFGCMGAVPAIEGYVVCSEFEDTLREAWEQEQIEAAKRAREKQEKRVYGNWKKLIQGLLIRERLAAKYEFSEETKSVTANKRAKHKKTDAKKTKVS